MSKFKTIDVWNRVYGEKQEAYDYTGRLMKKSACGNPNSSYHPTLDHIRPLSNGGCDVLKNIIICHRICVRENRVALFTVSIRADISLCEYDCGSIRNRSYQNQGGRHEGNRGEGTVGTGEGFAASDWEWRLRKFAKATGNTETAEGEVLPQHAVAFAALPQHCLDVGVFSGADRAGGGLPVRAIGYAD